MAGKTQEDERDFTGYADKVPTGTMEAFADWIIDEVFGGEFPGTAKDEKAFRRGVQLGGTLRMEFQASEYWKTDERNPRSPAGKKARAAANGAGPAKSTGRGKAKSQVEDDETEDEGQDEAPAKTTRQRRGAAAKPTTGRKPAAGKATTTATKPRTGRRGAAAKETAEAPY